jgi:hypothetical protein
MMLLIGRWFYVAMAAVTLVAVAVGFGRTYAAPMASGAFRGLRQGSPCLSRY